MTTIAYDGVTLASDSRAIGVFICQREFKKIYEFSIDGKTAYLGVSGDPVLTNLAKLAVKSFIFANKHEMKDACMIVEQDALTEKEVTVTCILIYDGNCFVLISGNGSWSFYPEAAPFAVGSGSEIAIGAMAAGATANEAVIIACRFDPQSAEPVQSFPT